jgi:precorrin-6A/cobalt-precorrin-6A reductase
MVNSYKAKVLVLGGISECARLAEGLLEMGFEVLVSRATRVPQAENQAPGLSFRCGPLDRGGLEKLARDQGVSMVIDCTHPYAALVSKNACSAARALGLPFMVYDRPGLDPDTPGIEWARDHSCAADLALARDEVVFLSIGSGNVGIYAEKAGKKTRLLRVRVLPGRGFLEKCLDAGLEKNQVIQARGPFEVRENILHMSGAGVLVTKDSGPAGGVPAKLEAAQSLGMRVIVVRRPPRTGDFIFSRVENLLAAVPDTFLDLKYG